MQAAARHGPGRRCLCFYRSIHDPFGNPLLLLSNLSSIVYKDLSHAPRHRLATTNNSESISTIHSHATPAYPPHSSCTSSLSSHLFQKLKISLSAHSCRSHICADVCYRHKFWAAFNHKRTFNSRFCHYYVIPFLPCNTKAICLKNLYKKSMGDGYDLSVHYISTR